MVTETSEERRRAARVLAARLGEALAVPLLVLDGDGAPIAGWPDLPRTPGAGAGEAPWPTRVSARLAGEPVEVLIGGTPHGGSLAAGHARVIVNLAAEQLALADGIANHEELVNRLLLEVLCGRPNEGEARRQAQLLGLDLRRPLAVIVIDASDFIGGAENPPADGSQRAGSALVRARRVTSALGRFFGAGGETIVGYLGDGEVVVLKERTDQGATPPAGTGGQPSWDGLIPLKRMAEDILRLLRREIGAEIAIGVGRYHPGLEGLARSYEDAVAAARLCRRFCGGGHVHALDGLGVEALAGGADEATRASLASRLLAPLQREPELLETLETYFAENCQPAPTVARLAIHRNTLAYRLEKVAALTGLDPRRFNDAVQLRLAFVLRGLHREPNPLCSRPTTGRSGRATLVPRPMHGTVATS